MKTRLETLLFASAFVSTCALLLAGCAATPDGPPQTVVKSTSKRAAASTPQSATRQKHDPLVARRGKAFDLIHGIKIADPYRWLEDGTNPETRHWTKVNDQHARRWLRKLRRRTSLRQRFRELLYVENMSAPIHRGGRIFWSSRPKNGEKAIWYWRDKNNHKTHVLLDPNRMSPDGSLSLRHVSIAWNGRKAAYRVSKNAADNSILYIMDVNTGKRSRIDTIAGARYAYPSWTPDSSSFYYTRIPVEDKAIPVNELPGHAEVYLHRLGTPVSEDTLIFAKTRNPRAFVLPSLSRDGRFLFVHIYHGWTRTDVYYRDLRRHNKRFIPLVAKKNYTYSVTAWKDWLYIRTNEGAPRYRVFRASPQRLSRTHWREIVPKRHNATLDAVDILGDHLVLRYLRNARSEVVVANLAGRILRKQPLPKMSTVEHVSGEPDEDRAFIKFSSFVQPSTIQQISVRSGKAKLYFQPRVPVDVAPYLVEQAFFPSKDGTQISIFIVRRKDFRRNGKHPLLLYGYGGFNVSLTPRFMPTLFPWLEAGGVFAMANLRGGGEYGETWHRAGMLTNKQNVFDDFVAAAEFLIRKRYTNASQLAIRGGSNGGLLVGAAITQRPELFRAASCHVPLLDMVRYHLFGAGQTWIAEYGNVSNRVHFDALRAYSPYHHLGPNTSYPALLMMSADSDDRVDPMHARKFIAAMRHANAGSHPILLRVENNAGHGGGDLVKKRVDSLTDEYAFLLHQTRPRSEPPRRHPSKPFVPR